MLNLPFLAVYAVAEGLAAAALLKTLRVKRSAAGVSYQTLLAFAIGHLGSFLFALVLPVSVSTMAYAGASLLSALCLGLLIRVAFYHYCSTYQAQVDSFGKRVLPSAISEMVVADLSPLKQLSPNKQTQPPSEPVVRVHWLVLYVGTLAVAVSVECFRQHKQLGQTLSAMGSFSDCLLGLALIPQLSMMLRSDKTHVARAVGTAVLYWTAARAASFAFW
ncbi:ER lumen protein retaining receptor [Gregarina niphandrodes]|uniref:ER lumen protein retaining receptor n=1 Tax=Gregarina niphandrodes TaxID=110365 RepID=A0A023BCM1_GRENI|nr:ER lumen protein retaining receptor [Gregarina niphandrodes]EZG83900.1 ER lumen protein retaining receptor [Gregarina niphandrodes]|eukprot:XP_011128899.1 ER lumen protein retaining receptor [Gregarina niphandrodes]